MNETFLYSYVLNKYMDYFKFKLYRRVLEYENRVFFEYDKKFWKSDDYVGRGKGEMEMSS